MPKRTLRGLGNPDPLLAKNYHRQPKPALGTARHQPLH